MQFSLNRVLEDLHKISRLRISVFDVDQNLITGYPEGPSDFCGFVRRGLTSNDFACLKQDLWAFKKVQNTDEAYTYRCHMGLLEAIAPLHYHGISVGYLMVGQALENIPTGKSRVISAASKLTKDQEYIESLLSQLPVLSMEDLDTFAHITRICAEYITSHYDFTVTPKNLAQEIMFYLNIHYSEKITMTELCQRFYSSKTTLNKVFQSYYQTSIFNKLNEIRIQEACVMLKTTELPIHIISSQCGFPDANYFSRIFRKTFHDSPSEFRKKYSGN